MGLLDRLTFEDGLDVAFPDIGAEALCRSTKGGQILRITEYLSSTESSTVTTSALKRNSPTAS